MREEESGEREREKVCESQRKRESGRLRKKEFREK